MVMFLSRGHDYVLRLVSRVEVDVQKRKVRQGRRRWMRGWVRIEVVCCRSGWIVLPLS